MELYEFIDLVATALAATHFGMPLLYYAYLRRAALYKPWNAGNRS